MFRNFISKLTLVSTLVTAPMAMASEDHPHEKGPHGGLVKGFGKYHLEGVRKGDTASFYLLGDDGKTSTSIAKSDGGSVTVLAPGKAQEKTVINPGASFSEATANLPAGTKATALVTIKEAGKTYSAKFNFSN